MSSITNKQKVFIQEYLNGFNAADAARRAGYKGTSSALAKIGRDNLTKPAIQHRINQAIQQHAMSAAEVILRLSRHARASMSDFFTETPSGEVKMDLLKALRLGVMDQVKYLVMDEHRDDQGRTSRRVEIALYDALNALTQLSRTYTASGLALADTIQGEPALPQGELTQSQDDFDQWRRTSAARVKRWLLGEYGSVEAGIITHSKCIFGEDFEPTPRFMVMAHKFFEDPSPPPNQSLTPSPPSSTYRMSDL